MHALMVTTLVVVLIGVPVASAQSPLSFAIEFSAGTLAAAVPFYAVLYRTSEALQPSQVSRFAETPAKDILLGLAVPPLVAGATVAYVGSLFGVTCPFAGLVAILGASVGEIFAVQLWQPDVPEWVKIIAVPALTSLGATIAFNRQARASR